VKIYSPKLARKGEVVMVDEENSMEKKPLRHFSQFLKDREITQFIPKNNHHGGA
jgi:hypothetical protein